LKNFILNRHFFRNILLALFPVSVIEKKFFSITDTGNKGNKIFLKKWGISIRFFKKHYLRSDTKYEGQLSEPKKNIDYFIDLIKVKLTYLYILFFHKI